MCTQYINTHMCTSLHRLMHIKKDEWRMRVSLVLILAEPTASISCS